jgi:hypothetical protein
MPTPNPIPPNPTPASGSQTFSQTAQQGSLNITQIQNPLNVFANYTYHIRFSLMSEAQSYNQDGTFATMNGASKVIIAESGVTAGFNIIEYEFKNTCAPGNKNLNTTNTTWTMTIVEPYGLSLIDKIISSGAVQLWNRAPYFIEVWFDGYNVDGTLMSPNQFYTQYRVILSDIAVKITEGGSTYSLTGVFDGDIGHSNEISIPQAQFIFTASNLDNFFTTFAQNLNVQTSTITYKNQSSPGPTNSSVGVPPTGVSAIINYGFNLPNDMKKWTFGTGTVIDQKSQRSFSMCNSDSGATTFTTAKGVSMENIINGVIATSPDAIKAWISTNDSSSSPVLQNGLSTWAMIHPRVKVGPAIEAKSGDYVRSIIYDIIPYKSIIVPTPPNVIQSLQDGGVQATKLNSLSSSGALVKIYDYIYTGLNTEIINLDISINTAFQLSQPQWLALNTYHNFTQGPLYGDTLADQVAQTGQINASSGGSNPPNSSSGISGTVYLEDIPIIGENTFPLITRPANLPTAPQADRQGDAPKSPNISTADMIPDSRPYTGDYLRNLFSNDPSFMSIELEIRGDPYWMGTGNVLESQNLAGGNFNSGSGVSGDLRAPYLFSSVMYILSFRTGENYDPSTGIMLFDKTSYVYNGAYSVYEVTNCFKNGNFTQILSSFKDIFSQNAASAVGKSGGSNAGFGIGGV